MNLVLLVFAAALLLGWVVRLVVTLRNDGYGLRPPPPSHEHDRPLRV